MCCVGGMVEETTHEATDHEFEPQYTRIYFFQGIVYLVPDAATGTKWTVHLVPASRYRARQPVLRAPCARY